MVVVGVNKIKNTKMNAPLPAETKYLGQPGEDPTSPFWASGNYVGPYWSDGKVQESVEWGDKPALHALDELARQHDAAYAHYKDEKHREAADMIFAEEAKKLKQKYGSKWADDPQIAARLVEYGNHTQRQVSKLAKIGVLGPAALPWLIYHQASNMIDNHKRIKGTYLTKEMGDVRKLYSTDPKKAVLSGTTGRNEKPPGMPGPTVDLVPGNSKESAGKASRSVKPDPPTKGPTAAPIHNAMLVEGQRRRFENYIALHKAAQRQPAKKTLINKKRVANKFGYVYPTEAVPFSEVVKTKNKNKKNAVRPL
nr:MAG: hypothetical protein 2 [Hubei sediment luteo-like virus 2]